MGKTKSNQKKRKNEDPEGDLILLTQPEREIRGHTSFLTFARKKN